MKEDKTMGKKSYLKPITSIIAINNISIMSGSLPEGLTNPPTEVPGTDSWVFNKNDIWETDADDEVF